LGQVCMKAAETFRRLGPLEEDEKGKKADRGKKTEREGKRERENWMREGKRRERWGEGQERGKKAEREGKTDERGKKD